MEGGLGYGICKPAWPLATCLQRGQFAWTAEELWRLLTELTELTNLLPMLAGGHNIEVQDPGLSEAGAAQAKALISLVQELSPRPEVVLVSPLTACLQTAMLAVQGEAETPLKVEVRPSYSAEQRTCLPAASEK